MGFRCVCSAIAELQSVRNEYQAGDYLTLDEYLAKNSDMSDFYSVSDRG